MIKFQVAYTLDKIRKVNIPDGEIIKSYINDFDTWDKAHNFIMDHANKKLNHASNISRIADKHYKKVSQLKRVE